MFERDRRMNETKLQERASTAEPRRKIASFT
jgi:hypothetical protein